MLSNVAKKNPKTLERPKIGYLEGGFTHARTERMTKG